MTRWGILGTGRIAGTFAEALAGLPDAELAAVGSRSPGAAAVFADRFRIARRHESYEALARDAGIEAIYIATPHALHCENSILCLDSGKAVLCEKPFAINADQARRMTDASGRNGRFLMEAMWTGFLPAMQRLLEMVQSGAIGEPRLLVSDFGFRAEYDPKSRLFDPALGGGALLDVGVYTVWLATRIFGEPSDIQTCAHLGKTGVDEQSAMILSYADGRQAALTCSIRTETAQDAWLYGTEGWVRIEPPFWRARRLLVTHPGKPEQVLDIPFEGNGYTHQAAEVMHCLAKGLIESPRMPHETTLQVMRTLDRLRSAWGLVYPCEARVG